MPEFVRWKNEKLLVQGIQNGDDGLLDAYLYWIHANETLNDKGKSHKCLILFRNLFMYLLFRILNFVLVELNF